MNIQYQVTLKYDYFNINNSWKVKISSKFSNLIVQSSIILYNVTFILFYKNLGYLVVIYSRFKVIFFVYYAFTSYNVLDV
jgi:hypothetical protein